MEVECVSVAGIQNLHTPLCQIQNNKKLVRGEGKHILVRVFKGGKKVTDNMP